MVTYAPTTSNIVTFTVIDTTVYSTRIVGFAVANIANNKFKISGVLQTLSGGGLNGLIVQIWASMNSDMSSPNYIGPATTFTNTSGLPGYFEIERDFGLDPPGTYYAQAVFAGT